MCFLQVMANICRICMEEAGDLLSIATLKRNDEIEIQKPGMMFEDCLGIDIADIPGYLSICMTCKIQLTYYYDFKRQALNTHQKLLSLLRKECDTDVESSISIFPFGDNKNDEPVLIMDLIVDIPDVVRCHEIDSHAGATGNVVDASDYNVEYLEDDNNHQSTVEFSGDVSAPLKNCEEFCASVKLEPQEPNSPESVVKRDNGMLFDYDEIGSTLYKSEETDESTDAEKSKATEQNNTRWKYHCEVCGKKFRNIEIYSGHLNMHQGLPPYCCEICAKEFKFKVNYDYHMRNHNNNRSFKCSVCTKSCLSKWDLKVHMRCHTDIRPYTCELCGKAFRVRSHMTDHIETHNQQNTYECPSCLQKYKTKASLKMHVTTVHIKTQKFDCVECGKIFYRKHHLKLHRKVHQKSLKVNDFVNLKLQKTK